MYVSVSLGFIKRFFWNIFGVFIIYIFSWFVLVNNISVFYVIFVNVSFFDFEFDIFFLYYLGKVISFWIVWGLVESVFWIVYFVVFVLLKINDDGGKDKGKEKDRVKDVNNKCNILYRYFKEEDLIN